MQPFKRTVNAFGVQYATEIWIFRTSAIFRGFKLLRVSKVGVLLKDAVARLWKPARQFFNLRSKIFGHNILSTKSEVTPFGLLLEQFKSPIMLILIFATITSVLLGDIVDAMIITLIVLGSAALSFFQEYSAGKAVEKLTEQVKIQALVLRDGQSRMIPADEIVPGDVVLLKAGSFIPADGVVLEGKDLFVSQLALTGETFPVEKTPAPVASGASLSERTNTVFIGMNIRSGSGKILIVALIPTK